MRKRFDLLVFDWDGTLMDSAACIAASLQAACHDLGYTVPSERDARYIIG
ncbi:MAG TPA: HAD family hydrolase, partial [Burkholderiales bacterium]|nr:HAD family hydrolase [Burkholderiales bacterium]